MPCFKIRKYKGSYRCCKVFYSIGLLFRSEILGAFDENFSRLQFPKTYDLFLSKTHALEETFRYIKDRRYLERFFLTFDKINKSVDELIGKSLTTSRGVSLVWVCWSDLRAQCPSVSKHYCLRYQQFFLC